MNTLCSHRHKTLFRVVISDGRTQVVERCTDCGENARGPGVWVPQRELPCPIDDLPLERDLRPKAPTPGHNQTELFS